MASKELAAKLAKQRQKGEVVHEGEASHPDDPVHSDHNKITNSSPALSPNEGGDKRPVVHIGQTWHPTSPKTAGTTKIDLENNDTAPPPLPSTQPPSVSPTPSDKRPLVHIGQEHASTTSRDIVNAAKRPSGADSDQSSASNKPQISPNRHEQHLTRAITAEFREFNRKQLQQYHTTFEKFDLNGDHYIDFEELKLMMEKLGQAQTHLALKEMIKEVDEDKDNRINFREFLLIFRKAAAGELMADSAWNWIDWAKMDCVDVTKEGVHGAKYFFEAKIELLTKGSEFEEEIRKEQEARRLEEEERKQRQAQFKEARSMFH